MDDGQLLIEMHNLQFSGDAKITDPDTGATETITFSGPYEVARIIYSGGKRKGEDGRWYPQFNVDEVTMEANPSLTTVQTYGQIPLYKSHKFENAIKDILINRSG